MDSLSAAVRRVHALETELERTREEQARLKDQFLLLVSHELRTPLNNLLLSITNVADGLVGEVSPPQRELLAIALSNADQLRQMIADILEITRAETGELALNLEWVDVEALLRTVADEFAPAATRGGVGLSLDLAGGLPPVQTDARRLSQVVSNLIDNAIKFTPIGGKVTLRCGLLSQSPPCLHIAVDDTGCGISSAGLNRVFQRFSHDGVPSDTDGRTGLGLGLYICNELVRRLGGRIWAESELGVGSSFNLTFQLGCDAAASEGQSDTGGVRE